MYKNLQKQVKVIGSSIDILGADPWARSIEHMIADFSQNNTISNWKKGSDRDIGGFSHAKIEQKQDHVTFSGYLSQQLPENSKVKRSGYAMIQSKNGPVSLDNNGYWDSSLYRYLVIRAKTDRRRYYVNIKCPSVIRQDIYQHLVVTTTPNKWETIVIPFNQFGLTSNGIILASQMQMYRQKIKSFGFSLTDGQEGPFSLSIAWMKMINSDHTDGDCDRIPRFGSDLWKSLDVKYE
ncbi:hypothetical protein BB559_004203 [Furculomyces boomerangus]|uniref:NADH:ubiquinone oxidoreductase intermediate-associated protein 30 domain-containing protein n=2 Tax=Harpellales TaxID=61421 RepID=A0A2T9YG31_9FUNG|nr:hypothetical protein BB559_004203 [Furculomyces boomerangus]PWA00002.1 hypothetical protein BB558_003962 [Smittium angustum]